MSTDFTCDFLLRIHNSLTSMAVSPLYFLTFLLLLFVPIQLALANNVTLGSTLSTNGNNPAWLSSSREFAFGFRPINHTNNTNLFLLAIWYNQIPDKTIVWNANADKPAPKGSTVRLTTSGLNLSNPQGEAIWTAEPLESVSYGAMLDTGNFVLASSGSNSNYVWESFKNPTDTLLPTQILELDHNLTSRVTQTNYTKGRFQLYFQDFNLLLSALGWPPGQTDSRYTNYFNASTSSAASANEYASQLVFNESADIYIEKRNGDTMLLNWNDNSPTLDHNSYYYRATLDFYGVFTQYAYPKGSSGQQSWSIVRYLPENICNAIFSDLGSGSCGYNSYCSIENQKPTCNCPDGYSTVDPSNQYDGCQPNFSLGCGADDVRSQQRPEEVYNFTILTNVNWPLGDYERLSNVITQADCQQLCLHDCMCAAAIFGGGTCWKKRLPLSNGRRVQDGTVALLKTRIHPLSNLDPGSMLCDPSDPSAKKDDPAKPVLLGSLIGSLVINGVLLATVAMIFLTRPKEKIAYASSPSDTNVHSFPYEALEQCTQGFSEELGRGSFGIVYKGTLNSSSNNQIVAVKKLDRLALEREREFRTELSAICKTSHKNLVRLIGLCDEGVHRLLVYEFMSNGTLADILFGQVKPIWNLRVRIALEIARGLVYLHEECGNPIIHCDIKPQNILIDEHFTAKISDFGLAKLLEFDQSRTHTMIRGTRGYVAPEWFKNKHVTPKVDVYSFGVMLLEIICCKRCVLKSGEEEVTVLTDWAYDCLVEGRIDALVEEDREAMADKSRLHKWVMIAIWCIQEHHEMRPTMKTVMNMLEGLVEVPNPPSPSSFTVTS